MKPMLLFNALLLILLSAKAQHPVKYNTFNYNVNEGLLQSHVYDLAFDKYNFAWLAFPNGVQRFDGIHFKQVDTQQNFPDDRETRFFVKKDSTLLTASRSGLSTYDAHRGVFTSFAAFTNEYNTPLFLGEYNGRVTMISSSFQVMHYNGNSLWFVHAIYARNGNSRKKFAEIMVSNQQNEMVCFLLDSVIYKYNLATATIIDSVYVQYNILSQLHLNSEGDIVYMNSESPAIKVFRHNYSLNTTLLTNTLPLIDDQLFRVSYLAQNEAQMFSVEDRVYGTNIANPQYKLYEVVNNRNEPVVSGNTIYNMKKDYRGNIYMLTISTGMIVAYPNTLDINYYGSPYSENNFTRCVIPDKAGNRIMVGTSKGFYIYDTLQQQQAFMPGRLVVSVIKIKEDKYLVFEWGNKDALLFNGKVFEGSVRIHGLGKNAFNYTANVMLNNKDEAWIQSINAYIHINKKTLQIYSLELFTDLTGGCMYRNGILYARNDELGHFRFADSSVNIYPLRNTGGIRSMLAVGNRVYVGANKGLFVLDSTLRLVDYVSKKRGIRDECIYAMVADSQGKVWCSTNQGLFAYHNGAITAQLTKIDGLQENEFNTNSASRATDGELFFGGVNGVSSFYPKITETIHPPVSITITDVRVNNRPYTGTRAVWTLDALQLRYSENSLAIDFAGTGNSHPSQYVYQYKMEGADSSWNTLSNLQTLRYYLKPGRYTLTISAVSLANKSPAGIKKLSIYIKPAFWTTWWFKSILVALFAFIIYQWVTIRNKRQMSHILRNLEQERILAAQRESISRDLHDSIGAYANLISYKTEVLEAEHTEANRQTLLHDLRFAAKGIITSLRENIWALKKDHYTAEECVLRISNFVQGIDRQYPATAVRLTGHAPAGKVLYYTDALNVVSIVQEAITNAVKHAKATHIIVANELSENSWKITVQDDGSGFDLNLHSTCQSGDGLNNMSSRAKKSSFALSITSGGAGTSLQLHIPLVQ